MRVVFSKAAQRHADTIGEWWRSNRPAASELFADELEGDAYELPELRGPRSSFGGR